jgi:hypothetical protein
MVLGELNLGGGVRAVNGVLSAVGRGLADGISRFLVPKENLREALALGKGAVAGISSLREAALALSDPGISFASTPIPGSTPSAGRVESLGNLSDIRLDDITFYIRPSERTGGSWDEVPETIKRTFDRLGLPEAERRLLAGVGAQYESEMVYHNILQALEKHGGSRKKTAEELGISGVTLWRKMKRYDLQ